MASGVMTIRYSSNGIRNAANWAAREFDDAADRMNKVAKRLDSMEERSRHDYLGSASAFLRKKEQQYRQKQSALETFAKNADSFMDMVKETDKRVAQHLEQTFGSFKRITGLGGGGFMSTMLKVLYNGSKALLMLTLLGQSAALRTAMAMIVGVKVGKWLKEWYQNGGKYWVQTLWSFGKSVTTMAAVITAVGTLVAGGPVLAMIGAAATVLGGMMVFISEFGGTVKNGSALKYHLEGNDTMAEYTFGMGDAMYTGVVIAEVFGVEVEATVKTIQTMEKLGKWLMFVGSCFKGLSGMLDKGMKITPLSLKSEYRKEWFESYSKEISFTSVLDSIKHDLRGMQLSMTFTGNAWGADADSFLDVFNFVKNASSRTVFNDFNSFGDYMKAWGKEAVTTIPEFGGIIDLAL